MKRLLLLSLVTTLAFACRENPTPESQAVTTAASETAVTQTQATETHATEASAPSAPSAPEPPVAGVTGPKLTPVDEATKDPTLVAFRDELLAAVRKRDAGAVVALADPKIRTSFGGGGGTADLRKALARPGMWEDLEQLLTMGGKFVGTSFWAPYVYSAWPDREDAFESLAVIAENVPLRQLADANARAVATLSYDIVQRAKPASGNESAWQHVQTADGKTGFVESRSVRSPVGYRAGFLKNADGKWKMNALVAGD
jgi:hypothetical protein